MSGMILGAVSGAALGVVGLVTSENPGGWKEPQPLPLRSSDLESEQRWTH